MITFTELIFYYNFNMIKKINKNNKNFLKFFIILLNVLLLYKKIRHKLRVCICTIGKLENLYVREFIEYYNKLRFDKIYIYDNNEINGELFETIIYNYIKKNYVEIINYRGYLQPQYKMMNSCYKMTYLKYDWIFFNDIDEFLYLKNFSNIKIFLNQFKYNKCKLIHFNFVFYTDNNNLYYKNESVLSRFKEKSFKNKRYYGKSIIRGNIPGVNISHPHYLTRKIKQCNGFGKMSEPFIIDSKYYYVKHFSFKSTEEYCDKLNRGNVLFDNNYHKKLTKISQYFFYNKVTISKIIMLENRTGVNLYYLRNKLKNNKKLHIKK